MNKRQRKKQDKKQQQIISKDKARIDKAFSDYKDQTIEVGDTVEIIGQTYDGYPIGTKALVITRDFDGDFKVSKDMDMDDFFAMYHHESDLKLIKKGTDQ